MDSMGNWGQITGTKQLRLDELRGLEAIIERNLAPFLEAGAALIAIREQGYFRDAGFATFEDYCHERWHFSRIRARQLIVAAEVGSILRTEKALAGEVAPLDTVSDVTRVTSSRDVAPPKTERQAREMARLAKNIDKPTPAERETIRAVWRDTGGAAGKPVPTVAIRAAVDRQLTPDPAEQAKRDADKMRRDCLDAIGRIAPILQRIDPETRVPYLDDAGMQELETLAVTVESWLAGVRTRINEREPF